MARKQRAEQRRAKQWRQCNEEERQSRVMVITEFDAGDPEATMPARAAEILRYRDCVRQLADAIGWISAGASFGLIRPGPIGVRGVPARVTARRRRRRLWVWRLIRLFKARIV